MEGGPEEASGGGGTVGVSLILLGNSVEASKVDAKSKRAVFLLNKEDRCCMGRARGTD